MFNKLHLRSKLMVSFLLAGIAPLIIVGTISYFTTTETIRSQASNQLQSVSEIKRQAVLRYFQTIHDQITTFSKDLMIVEAMKDYRSSFSTFISENELNDEDIARMKRDLKTYYDTDFTVEYQNRNNGASPRMEERFKMLDGDSLALQYHYIKANKNPLGSKEELDSSPDKSTYSIHHKRYHPVIRDYLRRFGYYDIFLCDLESGDIIYSVFKELDYSTSLIDGPYADTNFGRAFQAAKELQSSDELILVDYESYTPSYEDPASFIASPIFEGSRKIGVAIFQMPIDRLNEIMGEREGLGETGETYIVGSDFYMRSDSYLDSDHRSVTNSFRNPEAGTVKTESVKNGLAGKIGVDSITNYLGDEVLSCFRPIDIEGHRWTLIAEIKTSEAFSGANSLVLTMMLVAVVVAAIVIVISLLFAQSIVRPINQMITLLIRGTDETAGIADKVAYSSEEISKDVTNINRLMREAELNLANLSSMTSANADNANKVSEIASRTKGSADSGNEAMQRLNKAIKAIKESSEQTSNIIKTIDEIAFQTNLLALNAAVEAARAGEAGKGFAVVAEEVRSLATRSAKAAKGTGELLKKASEQAEDGVEVSNELGNILSVMINDIGRVNFLIDEVSQSSNSQASDITDTTAAIQEISRVINNTRARTDDNTNVGAAMTDQAQQLKEVVAKLIEIVYGSSQRDTAVKDIVAIENKKLNSLNRRR